MKGSDGIFEMTWADDGRATFEYGEERVGREPHIIWRRVGLTASSSGRRTLGVSIVVFGPDDLRPPASFRLYRATVSAT